MPKQRLINCDFVNASGFLSNLSNKAKLLYFIFLTNADDKGFVGNAKVISDSLDQCEENFENVLFQLKYNDAINELVDKRLVYEFSDKVGNKTYLIRHWFYHNKNQKFLTTNYISYLAQVDLIDNEYMLKNHQKEKPYKEKKIKENQIKPNKIDIEIEIENKEKENDKDWEKEWDNVVNELSKPIGDDDNEIH